MEVKMTNPSIPAKTREVFEYLKGCASQMRTVTYKEIAEEVNLAKSGVGRPLILPDLPRVEINSNPR